MHAATPRDVSPTNATFVRLLDEQNATATSDSAILYPLTLVVPITFIYAVIFVTGVVGNVSTCIVIARNRPMHTATNYYLFSLAISDLLLLVSGLPPEMYRIWSPETYVFGEAFCVLQGFAAETSANATVLTITAFTVERYLAICHPFVAQTMSKLSRAIRYIVAIWVVALCLAAPQAMQFGVEYEIGPDGVECSRCTIVSKSFEHAFEISTFVFFVGPMTLITVLYVLIGVQLRKSRTIAVAKKRPSWSNADGVKTCKNTAAQNRVVKMLVAVVAAFFICWAPFHAQRLLAVYLANSSEEAADATITVYMVLMHASGVLYFLSTTINPLLYHIMSNKFREAFSKTFSDFCRTKEHRSPTRTYSVISKGAPSFRHFQRSVSDGVVPPSSQQPQRPTTTTRTPARRDAFLAGRPPGHRPRYPSESSRTTTLSTPTIGKPTPTSTLVDGGDERYLRALRAKMLRIFRKAHVENAFGRTNSVDSSNTISNSSLQDMDEIEFSSSDLVRYMEEINEDLA